VNHLQHDPDRSWEVAQLILWNHHSAGKTRITVRRREREGETFSRWREQVMILRDGPESRTAYELSPADWVQNLVGLIADFCPELLYF
jgi:hypothetical protein